MTTGADCGGILILRDLDLLVLRLAPRCETIPLAGNGERQDAGEKETQK